MTVSTACPAPGTMLTGQELLDKTKALQAEGLTISQCAKACGYVSSKEDEDGSMREVVARGDYQSALLDAAAGISFSVGRRAGRSPVQRLQFRSKVMKPGNLVIAKGYMQLIEALPGTEFEIVLGKNCLQVVKAGEEADFSEEITNASEIPG